MDGEARQGPALTLTLMNLERFTTAYTVTVQPLARVRAPGQSMDSGMPSLSYLSAASADRRTGLSEASLGSASGSR